MDSKTGKSGHQGYQGIRKDHLDEIKRLMNPPQLVKDELTATVVLLGYTETQAKVSYMYIRYLFFFFFSFFFIIYRFCLF